MNYMKAQIIDRSQGCTHREILAQWLTESTHYGWDRVIVSESVCTDHLVDISLGLKQCLNIFSN